MRINEIEMSAAKGTALPAYVTMPELCLYTTLRAIYKSWHKQEISREKAQAEKRCAVAQCKKYEAEYVAWTLASKYYQENIRKSGTLLSDMEKASDVASMLDYAVQAIGCMTGDENFHKRIKNKIKEIYE